MAATTLTLATLTLATLARKMMLTPAQAIALPLVIEKAAGSVGLTETELTERCLQDAAVAGYLASICRTATK